MKPYRDLDVIKINELHKNIVHKIDIEIETIGDFNIDLA